MQDFWQKIPLLRMLFGLGAVCAYSGDTQAQELTIYGALTSDFVYRGVSNSDGHGAAQVGLDISSDSGLFGGVWASTTDVTNGDRNRSREVDYYFGYVRHFDNEWSASVSVNRYSFPGQDGNVDYEYTEFAAIIGFREQIWLEYDYTDSLLGHDASATNLEVLASWPLPALFSLSAGIGRFDISEFAGNAYSYWQFGVSRPVGWAAIDIRYHDTSAVPPRISAGDLADPRIVLTISAAF